MVIGQSNQYTPACVGQLDSTDSAESSEAEEAEDAVFWDKVTKPTGFKASAAQEEQELNKVVHCVSPVTSRKTFVKHSTKSQYFVLHAGAR